MLVNTNFCYFRNLSTGLNPPSCSQWVYCGPIPKSKVTPNRAQCLALQKSKSLSSFRTVAFPSFTEEPRLPPSHWSSLPTCVASITSNHHPAISQVIGSTCSGPRLELASEVGGRWVDGEDVLDHNLDHHGLSTPPLVNRCWSVVALV